MLTIWKACLLGIVQGATEFLPISSSGHLVVAQRLFGWTEGDATTLGFDVILHLGSLLAVIIIFSNDIKRILLGKEMKLVLCLIVATLPATIVGFAFKERIEHLFSSLPAVGIAWIITGVFLLATRLKTDSDRETVGLGDSLAIGTAQAIAIAPGISRSGSTIGTGLLLGLKREEAARFAFLMSIPAIGGSALVTAKDISSFAPTLVLPSIIGFIASFISSYIVARWLINLVKKGSLWYFGIYCLIAGVISILISLLRSSAIG
jgi:undecaprenyl-diphosphatase